MNAKLLCFLRPPVVVKYIIGWIGMEQVCRSVSCPVFFRSGQYMRFGSGGEWGGKGKREEQEEQESGGYWVLIGEHCFSGSVLCLKEFRNKKWRVA